MKKIFLVFIAIIMNVSLVSCIGKNTNNFVTGTFIGENKYSLENKSLLKVTEISKEDFDAANGVNVVQDKSDSKFNGKYYRINFSYYDDETNSYIEVEFNELNYTFIRTGERCVYYDKARNSIEPDPTAYSMGYSVFYNNKGYCLEEIKEELSCYQVLF